MIARLQGTIGKGSPGEVIVDVHGVGYGIHVPMNVWDTLLNGTEYTLCISTYVREDRFELYGFSEESGRMLFERFIELQGIGPRLGLELCAVPRNMLVQAIHQEDARLLTAIKGIGKKTAEKLLIELKNLYEKHPMMFQGNEAPGALPAQYDRDAIAALSQLGYTTSDIVHALETVPKHLSSTEERVTAALRNL